MNKKWIHLGRIALVVALALILSALFSANASAQGPGGFYCPGCYYGYPTDLRTGGEMSSPSGGGGMPSYPGGGGGMPSYPGGGGGMPSYPGGGSFSMGPNPYGPPSGHGFSKGHPGFNCRYLVRPGDNLFRIGLKYGVSWTVLAQANGLRNPNWIFANTYLRVPCR